MRTDIVEAFNNRKETTRHCMNYKKLSEDEYRITCLVWIINDKNQLLINQRGGHLQKNPNLWETISGNVTYKDNISSNAALRIVKEEYGLLIEKEDLEYIGCYKRTRDFVDVWLVQNNSTKRQLTIRADKVQAIDWVSPKKYGQMVKDGKALNAGFDIFRRYYKSFYKKAS